MIKYQLRTGKTVLLTTEQWLNLTDEDEQKLMANDVGMEINDPFQDFNHRSQNSDEQDIDIELEELPDEEIVRIQKEFKK